MVLEWDVLDLERGKWAINEWHVLGMVPKTVVEGKSSGKAL